MDLPSSLSHSSQTEPAALVGVEELHGRQRGGRVRGAAGHDDSLAAVDASTETRMLKILIF